VELGLYSFGDNSRDPETGSFEPTPTIYAQLIERAKLADEVGLSYFGLGEHHREDYPVSAVSTFLGALSAVTSQIRLGSAVTVLPTKDPVRLFEQFATLDVLSGGRAEITVGTGAYLESYPLFGSDLDGRQEQFTERLDLLTRLAHENPITWEGEFRTPLVDAGIWPRPLQTELPLWVAAGSSLESSERAAKFGANVMYSFLVTGPCDNQPLVEHYRQWLDAYGFDPNSRKVGIAGRGLVGVNSDDTKDLLFTHWSASMSQTAAERGTSAPSRDDYDAFSQGPGPVLAGSPNEIVDRLSDMHATLGNDRYIMHMDVGNVPHQAVMKSIELFGTEVLPQVAHLSRSSEK
jgi:alkanesulfonate monooxygenase SsuD/methylene tetrahydromethanopterin reductase-like flavin-dependent oxidoreductase (luciferase family)